MLEEKLGETSSSQDQPVIAADNAQMQSSSIKSLPSLEEMFKMVMVAGENPNNRSPTATPKIQTIQNFAFLQRENKGFKKYNEPRAVSLGPIHYGKPKYQLAEKYKLILASEFIKNSGKVIDELYKKIEDNIKEPRECYKKEATKDYLDKALTWFCLWMAVQYYNTYTVLLLTNSKI